jgi:hypothetical protein
MQGQVAMLEQRYKYKSDIRKQNVCLTTIKDARDSRQMRVLAAYFFLKQHFSHSIIYDYRSRKNAIGEILGVSDRTIHSYIVRWKAWGLVHEHKLNLVLTSMRKVKGALRERRRYKITTIENETIETIEARLYAKLLEEHANRITWHKRYHRYFKNTKRAQSGDANITDRGESPPGMPVSLSLRNIGGVLNVSRFKANEIIQKLNTLGVIITRENNPRKVCQAPGKTTGTRERARAAKRQSGYVDMTEGLPGYFYYSNGSVWQVFGNLHAFVEYPPNDNDLTYSQFLHFYKKSKREVKQIMQHTYTMKATQPLNFQ